MADFATLVATYTEGFSVIIEPQGSNIPGLYQPSACACDDCDLCLRRVSFVALCLTIHTL